MNFARAYNYIIGTVLIVIYLALPATNLAQAATQDGGVLPDKAACSSTTTAPCDGCPCSDGQGPDCCDTSFCSCACHAPLSQGLRLVYAPVIVTQHFREPAGSSPQVFLSIFVPPQNLA
ncbi:MAG: hypothetical protein WCD00_01835 [Desulfuromonadaceae bacterium]